ncbi:MAG: discoidin domain-containing protein, partial [bacterium]|nr:discoidin domain-containing protein [bacterium]
PRNIEQGLYLYDALPVLDEMDERESLTDGDYTTGTEIDIGSTGDINHNIGVDLGTSQECETIYLYTTDNYDPALSNAFFSWAVYYSDDGTNWNLVTSNAFFDYNTVYYRFEIDFPSQEARYLKAVNTHYDGRSFVGSTYITEIEILGSEDRRKEEVNKTTSSRWGNNFAVTLNPSKKLTLGYNFSCDYAESDPGSNLETKETSQLTHGTNISYLFHRYFSSSAQYGTSTRISDENRSENNSISLQFNSSPLDTLNTSLSFNHSESETENDEDEEEEEKVKSESNSCLYFLGAELWKGVDFGSNYNHTRSKSSAGTETMGHTINLDLRTKLTQNVTMESGYSHNWQKDENAEDEAGAWIEGSSVSAKLRYSPSDIFFLGSDYMYNKSEEGSDSAYGFNINWLPGEKIQLSFNSRYKLSESEQSNDKNLTCSLDASWNISRHIIF